MLELVILDVNGTLFPLDPVAERLDEVGLPGQFDAWFARSHVLDEHDTPAGEAALIAVHPWDVQGAIRAGLDGAWVDRTGAGHPDAFTGPSVRAESFAGAVDRLLEDRS